jgi:hypothetical protein
VVSLGDGGSVTVEFAGNFIVDDEGVDFIVFENPFLIGGDPQNPYAELGEVSVSQDGEEWSTFPCVARSFPYGACAGWHPVLDAAKDEAQARDPSRAGGDPYDLADVGISWVRYVRITDVVDDAEQTFDLDAVAIVHAGCPPEGVP